jgi:hypothetical protein
MWTMAVMAVLGLTTSVAEAGRYNDIDDHARDIEYQASRAQRIVKYDFRRLPVAIQKCLLTNLCGLEDNADCIRDLTRRDGNLDRIVEHVQVMSGQLAEVEEHIDELRSWCRSCVHECPRHRRSSCGTMSREHERDLRELCERVGKIRKEMECSNLHSHARSRVVIPTQPVRVAPPIISHHSRVEPRFQIGFSTSRLYDRRDDFGRDRGCSSIGRSRSFGHHRSAYDVPVFRHNGRSFGFSLSFR